MLGNLANWITGALETVFDVPFGGAYYDEEDNGLIDLQCGRVVFNDVPAKMRSELWLSQLHKHGRAYIREYSELCSLDLNPAVVAEIEKDTHRTFPEHRWLSGKAGQLAMLRVLRAYAAFDPEVGYAQGMNFLAGVFLAYLDEAEAFGALALVMQDRGLRGLYLPEDGMELLQVRLWQLGRLIPPHLSAHLEANSCLAVLYASSWFLTCFAAEFPLHFAARVMDLVVTDSYSAPLMKVAVHIVERCEMQLLAMEDMEEMVELLRKQVPQWPRSTLQDLLTSALGRGWSPRQTAVLKEMNGAESVADAVARVAALSSSSSSSAAVAAVAGHAAGGGGGGGESTVSSGNLTGYSTKALPAQGINRKSSAAAVVEDEEGRRTAPPSSPSQQQQRPSLTLFPLPPPPTSRQDKIEWTQWQHQHPSSTTSTTTTTTTASKLKSVSNESIKIDTELNDAEIDPQVTRQLSEYLLHAQGNSSSVQHASSAAAAHQRQQSLSFLKRIEDKTSVQEREREEVVVVRRTGDHGASARATPPPPPPPPRSSSILVNDVDATTPPRTSLAAAADGGGGGGEMDTTTTTTATTRRSISLSPLQITPVAAAAACATSPQTPETLFVDATSSPATPFDSSSSSQSQRNRRRSSTDRGSLDLPPCSPFESRSFSPSSFGGGGDLLSSPLSPAQQSPDLVGFHSNDFSAFTGASSEHRSGRGGGRGGGGGGGGGGNGAVHPSSSSSPNQPQQQQQHYQLRVNPIDQEVTSTTPPPPPKTTTAAAAAAASTSDSWGAAAQCSVTNLLGDLSLRNSSSGHALYHASSLQEPAAALGRGRESKMNDFDFDGEVVVKIDDGSFTAGGGGSGSGMMIAPQNYDMLKNASSSSRSEVRDRMSAGAAAMSNSNSNTARDAVKMMSPASSRALLLQQAQLKEFAAGAAQLK